jgi:hypothetical protein
VVPTSSVYLSTEPRVLVHVLQNRLAWTAVVTSIQSCLAFFSVAFFIWSLLLDVSEVPGLSETRLAMIKLCHDPDRPSPSPRVSEILCGCDGQSYGQVFLPRLASYAVSCAQETDVFAEAAEATPETSADY